MAAEYDDGRDAGFTLMEVLVVVLLVAVLTTVMVAIIAVILRNAPSTEANADDSVSYQRLVRWLPRDVASTPPAGIRLQRWINDVRRLRVARASSNCAWAPNDDRNTTYAADYRLNLQRPPGAKVHPLHVLRHDGRWTLFGHPLRLTSPASSERAQATPTVSGTGVTIRLTTCGNSACNVDGPIITVEAGSRIRPTRCHDRTVDQSQKDRIEEGCGSDPDPCPRRRDRCCRSSCSHLRTSSPPICATPRSSMPTRKRSASAESGIDYAVDRLRYESDAMRD